MRALVQAVEAGDAVLDGCARRRRVLASALVEVDLWRCVHDGPGLRGERSHPLPVLTVLLSGASVLHESGRAVVMETGTALLTDAGVAYRSPIRSGAATWAATCGRRRRSWARSGSHARVARRSR